MDSYLDELVEEYMGVCLTVFFEPTDVFLTWLADEVGTDVLVEVGIGTGHAFRKFKERGIRCIGIEPRFDVIKNSDLSNCVFRSTVENTKAVLFGQYVLFARPSHNDFVQPTVERLALEKPEVKIIYVGLEKNFEIDFDCGYEVIMKDVGKDGEVAVWLNP